MSVYIDWTARINATCEDIAFMRDLIRNCRESSTTTTGLIQLLSQVASVLDQRFHEAVDAQSAGE